MGLATSSEDPWDQDLVMRLTVGHNHSTCNAHTGDTKFIWFQLENTNWFWSSLGVMNSGDARTLSSFFFNRDWWNYPYPMKIFPYILSLLNFFCFVEIFRYRSFLSDLNTIGLVSILPKAIDHLLPSEGNFDVFL